MNRTELDDESVVSYLKQHPDFFQNHLDLLEVLHIPHPSGNAVSLISKQLEIFRAKHQEQESQLNALIEIARENDASFNGMHELALALLEANSLQAVVSHVTAVMVERFQTDFVAIKVFSTDQRESDSLFVSPDDEVLKHFGAELGANQPKCGRPTLAQADFLFGDSASEVRSCAIIPMVYTQLEGLIAIGGRDDRRFHYSMGTLFLAQISDMIATRMIALLPTD